MSVGDLRPGKALFLRSFKNHPEANIALTYGAPSQRSRYHLAVWLGTWAEGELTAAQRLNAMGWHYKLDGLLSEAREYVADSLDAMEHSDGRDLLDRIDAALAPTS